MSSSPFEALTRRERQERWLEFQNTRLPYINISEPPETIQAEIQEKQADAPSVPTYPERQDFGRVRHRQYDAVIQRMRQAERQATRFQKAD